MDFRSKVGAPLKRPEVWVPLLAACTFLPSLHAGFVYDDVRLIVENAYIKSADLWARAFSTHFWDISGAPTSPDLLRLYRPLVTLSYLWNWLLGSGQAWTFHVTNVLLHALNTWLVLVIGLRLTRRLPLHRPEGHPRERLVAVACALLFALHPTRAEAVTWVSGRPDPLMTVFVLATVQLVYWGRDRGARPVAALVAALAFCGALCSKEPALAAPVLLLADATDAPKSERAWHLGMVSVTTALALGYLLLRHALLPVGSPPLVWTPAEALVTVSHYAERTLFPWPLTFFYDLETAGGTASAWDLGFGAALAVGTLAWAALAWRRDRVTFWLLLAGIGFLGPLLNLTQTGARFTTCDRYLYFPLWLLSVAGGRSALGALSELQLRREEQRRAVKLALAGAFALCAIANVRRAIDFFDEESLWKSELALNPDNPVALRGLAAAAVQRGDTREAIRKLEHSLQLRALRYQRVVTQAENADSYGKLLALEASTVADGSVTALQVLVQEGIDRLAGKSPQARTRILPIDWPESEESARSVALQSEEGLARHLVGVATRIEIHEVSLSLLDAISDQGLHLAPNPLLVGLSEARERRFARALGRIDVMRKRRHLMPKVVTEAALRDLEARVVAAGQLFAAAESFAVDDARLARARALGSLGAFLRALLEVQRVDPRHPGMLPLYVQLLMSARLEAAALQVATSALGAERATATLDLIRAQLPPDLRNLAPVALDAAAAKPADL